MKPIIAWVAGALVLSACQGEQTQMQPTGAQVTEVATLHTDFQATGEPASDSVNSAGLQVVRGLPYRFDTLDGDLNGHQVGVFSFNVDPGTGDGTGFGTFVLDVSWGDRSGTFEGSFGGSFTGGVFCGHYVGSGTAEFDGMTIHGSFCETGAETDTYNSSAQILSPRS